MLSLVVLALITLLFFVKRQYSYWENRGIPQVKPNIPFGNLLSVVKKERSFGTAIYDIYKESKEPFLGIYLFFRPALLIRDAETVKNILTRDFQHFHDRGIYCDTKNDPISGTLFALPGEVWKALRPRLSPAFTTGKLKGMFSIIQTVGQELVELLEPLAEKEESIEIRDIAGRFVVDCLASIAFGQDDVSTLKNPDHEFRTSGKKINDNTSVIHIIRRTATFVCPRLLKIFRVTALPDYMRDFCVSMVTKTIDNREKHNIIRKDLMQYLIQLRNNDNGSKAGSDEWKINSSGKFSKSMTYEEIAAQVFVFYIAGSESSSSTVAYTIYELTQNEDLMVRAVDDIEKALKKHNGELTYESIAEMEFIDLCVKETLRKYPGLPILNRECTKDYHIPGTKITIEKGTSVVISLLGVHRDERFFPEAEKYSPDRFDPDNGSCKEDMYMPFGIGPRNCVAYRMGLLISKAAIVKLLMSFNFKAFNKRELDFDHGTVGLLPVPGQCKVIVMKK